MRGATVTQRRGSLDLTCLARHYRVRCCECVVWCVVHVVAGGAASLEKRRGWDQLGCLSVRCEDVQDTEAMDVMLHAVTTG